MALLGNTSEFRFLFCKKKPDLNIFRLLRKLFQFNLEKLVDFKEMMKKGRYLKKEGQGGGGVKAKKMVTTGCVEG